MRTSATFLLTQFCLFPLWLIAQDLAHKQSEIKDNKLVIHYSLSDSVHGRSYTVRLYSSKDNFLNPMENVSGDIGLEVKPGVDNRITWDPYKEFGTAFNGKVSLEIRSRIFIPFISTESINQYRVYKRKRKYNITWTGGSPQNILNFDLYRGERKIISFANIANVGTHAIEFPSYIKPGKNYRFRISDSKNGEEVVYTNEFRITRKLPLLIQIVPALAVGSAFYFLLKPQQVEEDLPDAPVPNK